MRHLRSLEPSTYGCEYASFGGMAAGDNRRIGVSCQKLLQGALVAVCLAGESQVQPNQGGFGCQKVLRLFRK